MKKNIGSTVWGAVSDAVFMHFWRNGHICRGAARIPDGVEVEGLDLSNMDSDEAKAALTEYVESVKAKTLHLTAGDDTVIDIPFSQFGVDIADPSVIDALSRIGSGGNVLKTL